MRNSKKSDSFRNFSFKARIAVSKWLDKMADFCKNRAIPLIKDRLIPFIRQNWKISSIVAGVLVLLLIVLIISSSGGRKETKPVTEDISSEVSALLESESSALEKDNEKVKEPEAEQKEAKYDDNALTADIQPGVLYYFNKPTTGEPLITGVSFSGNQAGEWVEDGGSINGRPFDTQNIRWLFEMNEWVDMIIENSIPDEDIFDIYVLESENNVEYYTKTNPEEYGYIGVLDGYKSDYGDWHTMQFFIDPEYENKPGYYDVVYCYQNKPIAMVRVKMVKEATLSGLSDAQLEEMMKNTKDK